MTCISASGIDIQKIIDQTLDIAGNGLTVMLSWLLDFGERGSTSPSPTMQNKHITGILVPLLSQKEMTVNV